MTKPVKKYLSNQNRAPTLAINTGLLWWIACDYFHASMALCGVVGTLWAILFIAGVHGMCTKEPWNIPE